MKISVIIPVYNEETVIVDCLNSLSKQSLNDFEVIVVDDGSTDQTLRVLSKLKVANKNNQFFRKIVKLQILKQKHKGAGAARNLGAEFATGTILIFVDADMIFSRDFLQKLIKPILDGGVIGTFSKEEYLKNKENIWAVCWNLNRGLPRHKMHNDNYPDTQKVFRAILKDKFIEAGGFDPRAGYADDGSLAERLTVEAVSAPDAVYYHQNPGTLKEVFDQSRWMSKRKYKLGLFGYLVTLLFRALPFSLFIGIYRSIIFRFPGFLVFRIVSDFGQFVGIIEFMKGKVSR